METIVEEKTREFGTTALKSRVEERDLQKGHQKSESIKEGKGKVCEFFKPQFLYLKIEIYLTCIIIGQKGGLMQTELLA